MLRAEDRPPGARREDGAGAHQPGEAMLQIRNVSFSYPDRAVLEDVSLSVRAGEIMVLLGPNGAGKSTIVKTISGQIRPAEGSVRIDGDDPVSNPKARAVVGFVPQSIALFNRLTVDENLCTFGEVMGAPRGEVRARAERTLQLIGLEERRRDRLSVLSGGMQRLVNIGAALMHSPGLLILDEPTVGVDNRTRDHLRGVMRALRESGLAILLTTHDMEEAEALADRIAIIVAGRIRANGLLADIVADAFGARQLVRIVLDPDSLTEKQVAAQHSALRRLGLEPVEGQAVWEGLIAAQEDGLPDLGAYLSGSRQGVKEVRVRQPGLRALLEWYTR